MRVEQLGDGTPEVAVVGGIHGDEPCGVRAVERLIEEQPPVERPVKLIVANEEAIERGVRYVDEDLNRAFARDGDADDGGDTDGDADSHERRLAHRLAEEVAGCTVLAHHSTQSHAEPFALVRVVDDVNRDIVTRLSVTALVETGPSVDGRIFTADCETVEVECGLQGTETAAENAYRLTREFLTTVGALPGDTVPHDLPVFRLRRPIPKERGETYEVFVENFTRVEEGETFAAVDGEPLVADKPFYPVLVSPYGYEDVFGYTADKVGDLTS
jgi:succinylglutamate desuccinylase